MNNLVNYKPLCKSSNRKFLLEIRVLVNYIVLFLDFFFDTLILHFYDWVNLPNHLSTAFYVCMYWHLEFQFFLFFSLRLFSSALNVCLSLTFDVADNYLLERWQSSSKSVLLARYRTYLQVFTFAVAMKYSACDTVRICFCFFSFFNLISLLFSSSSS